MSKLAKLLLVLSMCQCARTVAQDTAVSPSPDLVGIAHVAFRVSNLNASLAFYSALGFEKSFELSRDGKVYEAFIKVNDRQFIELYPTTSAEPQPGFLHICFEGKNLVAVRSFYLDHGLRPTEITKGGAGNLLFSMKGPATPMGPQNIEYTQYMPGSMHSRDFGQHLGPSRVATQILSVSLVFDNPTAARSLYFHHAGFTASKHGELAIPGAQGESISIASTQRQGFHGRLILAAMKTMPNQTDPDGNLLLFEQRP